MASKKRPTRRTAAKAATPATEVAPQSETDRIAALSVDEEDDDDGPAHAREYFARVGKNLDSPALIGDIVGMLEHFGILEAPEPSTNIR